MQDRQAENITMSEGGLYSLATRGAKDVIDFAMPRVLQALTEIKPYPDRMTIADLGCADAGTSLDMIRGAIHHIQNDSPQTQVTIIYADQPANDFNALISIVHGRTRFESWVDQFDNAFPLVSGSSFYLRAVPDESLDLVFSATAMHWLSTKPCNITRHVHMVGASGPEFDAFSRQAREDWETILLCRAREMKRGSKMVLVNFCRDEQGRYLGNTGGVNMFDTFDEIWKEFVASGRITRQEYENMTLPQYYRTAEEFSSPLVEPESPCFQAGLRLDSLETRVVPCPFSEAYKRNHDIKAFADGLVPTVRSWNQSIFKAGLDRGRDPENRNQIIEDYYAAYHRRVMDSPQGHGMDYVHAYMTISRV
ncbi:MAG: SAM-dependent methyltransferase [Gammaproteobacteria bacterium]|nr:SAM-dependent methyltransferase [Gammaproteobacteria bacterium]